MTDVTIPEPPREEPPVHRVDLQEFVRDPGAVMERTAEEGVAVVEEGVVVAVFGASVTAGFQDLLPPVDWGLLDDEHVAAFRSMRWFE